MKKKLRHIIVVNILIFIILVGILEIILSTFFPIRNCDIRTAYRYDPELTYTLKENINISEVTDFRKEVITDKNGYSGFETKADKFDKLIFAIGDSYVKGTGLSVDEAFPFQLNLQLNTVSKIYSPKYHVVNLGVGGFSPSQEIIRLKKALNTNGTPDYIIYMGCSNDYSDDKLFLSGNMHKYTYKGSPGKGLKKYAVKLLHISQVLQRLRLVVNKIKAPRQTNSDTSQQTPSVAELIAERINTIKTIAEESNATLIVTWADVDNSYTWLKNWAQQNNVKFADWYESVKAVQDVSPNAEMINPHSGAHYRSWVNFLIAKTCYHIILD